MLHSADKLREQLAARIRWLEVQYASLHSQVSGYLHGEDWRHWEKYNEPRFAPSAPRTAPNAKLTCRAEGTQHER
jgi:hypothetical protein